MVYKYEVKSLPSNDGRGIVQIYNDPAVTMTIGAQRHRQPVTVGVDVEFYDENDQLINLANHTMPFCNFESLKPLNGASYVEEEMTNLAPFL